MVGCRSHVHGRGAAVADDVLRMATLPTARCGLHSTSLAGWNKIPTITVVQPADFSVTRPAITITRVGDTVLAGSGVDTALPDGKAHTSRQWRHPRLVNRHPARLDVPPAIRAVIGMGGGCGAIGMPPRTCCPSHDEILSADGTTTHPTSASQTISGHWINLVSEYTVANNAAGNRGHRRKSPTTLSRRRARCASSCARATTSVPTGPTCYCPRCGLHILPHRGQPLPSARGGLHLPVQRPRARAPAWRRLPMAAAEAGETNVAECQQAATAGRQAVLNGTSQHTSCHSP